VFRASQKLFSNIVSNNINVLSLFRHDLLICYRFDFSKPFENVAKSYQKVPKNYGTVKTRQCTPDFFSFVIHKSTSSL